MGLDFGLFALGHPERLKPRKKRKLTPRKNGEDFFASIVCPEKKSFFRENKVLSTHFKLAARLPVCQTAQADWLPFFRAAKGKKFLL